MPPDSRIASLQISMNVIRGHLMTGHMTATQMPHVIILMDRSVVIVSTDTVGMAEFVQVILLTTCIIVYRSKLRLCMPNILISQLLQRITLNYFSFSYSQAFSEHS